MANNRDDFTGLVKRTLADRVGWFCSFPGCNQATIGPSHGSDDAKVNNGIAAHICAAAKGGPRYDPSKTSDERKSIDNGIWMCRYHGGLIDADLTNYTVDKLKSWKILAEENAAKRLQLPNSYQVQYSDADIARINNLANAFSYEFLNSLRSEPFRAKVPTWLIDQLYRPIDQRDNPNLYFRDAHLEQLRQNLLTAIDNFFRTFGKQSAGGVQFYDYIDLNDIRDLHPENVDQFVKIIEKTQDLARAISEAGWKFLEVQAGLATSQGQI
jgi:hypothetical protein